jgi:hypothetical protein
MRKHSNKTNKKQKKLTKTVANASEPDKTVANAI